MAPRYMMEFLRFGVEEGERRPTLFRCADWMTEQGAPAGLVHAMLTEPGHTWLADVETGRPGAPGFKLAAPFDYIDVRPNQLILMGGPPLAGKTAALLQMGIDLSRLNDNGRLIIANVEIAPVAAPIASPC